MPVSGQPPKPPERPSSERARQMRQVSLAMMIPGLMAAGPIVGWGLAYLAQRFLGAPEWTTPIGIALGLAAGVRQVIRVIRDLNR